MKSTSYLFRRPNSRNWYYRYTYPEDLAQTLVYGDLHPKAGKRIRTRKISLRTDDIDKARIEMLRLLREDINFVALVRGPVRRDPEKWAQEPDTIIDHPNGTFSVATQKEIRTYGIDRKLISIQDNYKDSKLYYVGVAGDLSVKLSDGRVVTQKYCPPDNKLDLDTEVLNFWKKVKAVKPTIQREADRALVMFKEVCPGRSFVSATRIDGRTLADHMFDKGLKSHTVRKMVGHLRAAMNLAIDNPEQFPALKLNPFTNVVKDRNDEQQRKMFDDADMALIKNDIDSWGTEERLLWVLCAATGMRRSEAWQITSEERIDGFRVVRIGTKTDSSDRTIPLPSCVLGYMPEKITGCLFKDTPKNVGKRVIRNIRDLGITDPAKVLHSTRHRASTRLHGVKDSVRDAILGHDDSGGRGGKKRASNRYFGGHPVKTIAQAIETIGF